MRQLVDVDAACGDVGGAQYLQIPGLELGERARACALALVAVDRERGDAVLVKLLGQAVGAVLGAREHQHLVPVVRLDQVGEQLALAVAIDRVDFLADDLHRRIAARDFDHRRRIQEAVGERLDLRRKGRREQQVLPALGQEGEDALDVADEAHVQHAVGFVEHQYLDVREIDGALLLQIEQAARCRDKDIDAALQFDHLRVDADAAEHDCRRPLRIFTVDAHALFDLRGELARRRQDQHAHGFAPARGRRPRAGRQELQDRQYETSGLAGTGLRAGQKIAACKHGGDRLNLDGCGNGIAVFGDRAYEVGGQAEIFK